MKMYTAVTPFKMLCYSMTILLKGMVQKYVIILLPFGVNMVSLVTVSLGSDHTRGKKKVLENQLFLNTKNGVGTVRKLGLWKIFLWKVPLTSTKWEQPCFKVNQELVATPEPSCYAEHMQDLMSE